MLSWTNEWMNEWHRNMKIEWTIIQVYNHFPHSNKRKLTEKWDPIIGPAGLGLNDGNLTYFGGERNSGLRVGRETDKPAKRRRRKWKNFQLHEEKMQFISISSDTFWHPPNLDAEVSANTHEEKRRKGIHGYRCYSLPGTLLRAQASTPTNTISHKT